MKKSTPAPLTTMARANVTITEPFRMSGYKYRGRRDVAVIPSISKIHESGFITVLTSKSELRGDTQMALEAIARFGTDANASLITAGIDRERGNVRVACCEATQYRCTAAGTHQS